MNQSHSAIIHACSWLAGHARAFAAGLAVVWVTLAPVPMRAQWNGTNPVWTNSNVGIGTANPAQMLHVHGSGAWAGMRVTSASTGTTFNDGVHFGYDGSYGAYIWNREATAVVISTSDAEKMRIEPNGNVGIGTANPQYKLAVNGNIGAQDIIVTNTGWSDYVFQPGYRLRPLSEVSAFIHKHRHLPDIPTEAEVKEKGVSVGEMQAKLLAKVEELTLHLIQQEKENKELRERVAQLENRASANGGVPSGW
jgi:hypothetical protein